MTSAGGLRRQELAANLADVRHRIAAACAAAGRDPAEITLIAVTKTRPADDVMHLASLGVGDVGENRDQEAAGKAAEVAAAGVDVRWHFIGQLQRKKCKTVARYASAVHSVDGVRLAVTLDDAARNLDRRIDVLVQVSIDGDPARGGAVEGGVEDADLDRVLAAVAAADRLSLKGLMAVAPLDWQPRRAFAELAEIRARMLRNYPDASLLSAGMTSDVEEAIQYGSTHVRIGTALLGTREGLM